jgi:hypothetical protein
VRATDTNEGWHVHVSKNSGFVISSFFDVGLAFMLAPGRDASTEVALQENADGIQCDWYEYPAIAAGWRRVAP